jgi:hypothetical protein
MNKFKKKYFGYVEGVIYVLLTIVVIFANIAGPIMIKLLPFVFILGIVGRIVFNRPIITAIFSFIVSICTIYLLGTYTFTYNLMYSLFCFICILIGEVAGMYLVRLVNSKSKKTKNINFKDITALILLALAGIYLNNYVNGNIYAYLKSKQKIENYIKLNYSNSENVKVFQGKYIFNKYKYYSFEVKNIDITDNTVYKFGVYSDDKIIDGYENSRLLLNSKLLKLEFEKEIDLSKYINFDFDIEYSDLKNNITVYITKSVDEINLNQLNNFSEDVNNILDNISKFGKFYNISKINICIKDKVNKLDAEIYNTNFYDKEYYINSLETEYLDK